MLLGWSAAWAAGSVVGLWLTGGRGFWQAFWFMNGLWCAVNSAIGVWSLLAPPSEVGELRALLLINAGLDIVYLGIGVALLTRRLPMVRGFGAAILVQGAFLLTLDLARWAWLGGGAGG